MRCPFEEVGERGPGDLSPTSLLVELASRLFLYFGDRYKTTFTLGSVPRKTRFCAFGEIASLMRFFFFGKLCSSSATMTSHSSGGALII